MGAGRHRRVLGPPAGFGVADHALAHVRAGSVGGRLHDQPRDVLAWPVPGAGILEPEYLTPVDRERLHLQRLAGSRFLHAGLGDGNQRPGTIGGNKGLHPDS